MDKIYISPSSQYSNMYSVEPYSEGQVCYQIGLACRDRLMKHGYRVEMPESGETGYQDRVKESNNFGAELHICIHTNAGGGDGTVVFCHRNSKGNKYVKAVYEAVAAISPGEDDGIRVMDNLYEINKTRCTCVYVEVEFHDHKSYAQWIVDNIVEIGNCIADAVAEADGSQKLIQPTEKYVVKTHPMPEKEAQEVRKDASPVSESFSNKVSANDYEVIFGTFSNKDSAERLKEILLSRGVETDAVAL